MGFPLAIGVIFMLLGIYLTVGARRRIKQNSGSPIPATVTGHSEVMIVNKDRSETPKYYDVLE